MTEKLFTSPYGFIRELLRRVPRGLKIAVASTFIIGLATHMFVFTNTLFIGDGLKYYYYDPNDRPAYTRFLLHTIEKLHNWLQIPWVIGLLELAVLSVAIYYIYKLFELKGAVSMVLTTGIFITFPVLTTYNAHLFSAVGYAVAVLSSVLSVYTIHRWSGKKQLVGTVVSAGLFFVSLALYQAAICFSATLMALLLIKAILADGRSPKRVFGEGGLFVAAFLVGLAVYLLVLGQLRESWPGAESVVYTRGITAKSVLGRSPQRWLADIWNAFSSSLYFYFKPQFLSFIRLRDIAGFAVIFLAGAFLTLRTGLKNGALKKPLNAVLVALLFLLLPFTMNMFQLLGPLEFRIIMYYPLVLPLIYAIWLVDHSVAARPQNPEEKRPKGVVASAWGVILATVLLCFNFWMLANTCYLAMSNTYEKSLLLANRVMQTVQTTPGYNYGTPIYIIGAYQSYPELRPGFEVIEDMSGIYYNLAFHNNTYFPDFVEAHLGTPIYIPGDVDEEALLADPRVQEMPNYPVAGYVQFVDELLVIKFN